jgi:large subunit ribosomal protein L32e
VQPKKAETAGKKTAKSRPGSGTGTHSQKQDRIGSERPATTKETVSAGEKKTLVETKKKTKKEKKERVPHQATPERRKRAKIQKKIARKRKAVFRGRFGKPNVRRKSIEKWQKWRKPRGIDIRRGEHKGKRPNSGFRTPVEIRGLHPSGFAETRIASLKELKDLKNGFAVRITAAVGQKKRKQIIAEAKQKGIRVLN